MSQMSVASFRLVVPNNSLPSAPVAVEVQAMSSALHKIIVFTAGAVDLSKCGIRIRNNGSLLVPDGGSMETGIAASEGNFAPLSNSPVDLFWGGRVLVGSPFSLFVEVYNTTGAAINVGGFVHTCMPELTLTDLIREIKAYQEKIQPIAYDTQVKQTARSDDAPYPVQRVNSK